jgi:hypothetical protein
MFPEYSLNLVTIGVVGTNLCTAPEIEKGLPHDSKVDIDSLGIR